MQEQTDYYEARCNDPVEREKWRNSGLVTLDTLRFNAPFECIDGTFWAKLGRTHTGTIEAEAFGNSGEKTTFIEKALVRPF